MASAPGPHPPRKGNLWRTVKAVAWSMLGVRKGSEWQEDGVQVTPLQVIAVGLVAIFLFVLGLMALVKWLV
ncbi:hypothetical protein GCM10027276_43930 [Comamonas piscis]